MPLDRDAALDRFRRGRARTRALFALLDAAAYDRLPAAHNPLSETALAADAALEDAILHADLERGAQALSTLLEDEELRHETLACLWHQFPYEVKRKPEHYVTAPPRLRDRPPVRARVSIPAGVVTLGTPDVAHRIPVTAFDIDSCKVTNADYLAFVEATGAPPPHFWDLDQTGRWSWRGMFERVPLPLEWPVYVTWTEADAYARWRGRRLPTEPEFQRAAFGTPDGHERRYPWGDTLRGRPPANFDFARWDPSPVGTHAGSASAFGVDESVGNGWEWTSTPFDAEHYVLKGASPVTSRTLVRPGFRRSATPHDPFIYATFRTAV